MQKLLLLIITIIVGLFVTSTTLKGNDFSNGIQKSETKTFNLSPFDAVKTSQAIEVEIVKSNEEKAVATSTHLAELKIEVKNKILYIQYKPNVSLQNADTKVVVYAKNLVKAEAGNASSIKVKSVFEVAEQTFESNGSGKIDADSKASVVNINTNSAGTFSGKINTKNLNIDANSASSVKISGSADNTEINVDSASSVDAKNMNIQTAKATASATSTITLSVSKELTASASSLAKIRYKTLSGIKFSASRSSGGTIDML
ncbi:DUF2807 domain-containing protein [Chryseobacterium sp. SSA4.19]|uniref:GIN domain-containing protein n=1 Tax=Chryseobacterium sp. SSA4.19 TaxID=2919915 RepID=UPI001F4EA94C|nr:DUF2807 domain-containing protein [Chryseobacterium sp. SSA4.19]MCJ8155032.1 DUF2807 domain-containing protein [Chryseobacterium sp. SSA4.19]